jgi:hypothetical protein
VFLECLCCRAQEESTQLFGNPAIRLRLKFRRTRGFASPDFSGFALSEIFVFITGGIQQQHEMFHLPTKYFPFFLNAKTPLTIKFSL